MFQNKERSGHMVTIFLSLSTGHVLDLYWTYFLTELVFRCVWVATSSKNQLKFDNIDDILESSLINFFFKWCFILILLLKHIHTFVCNYTIHLAYKEAFSTLAVALACLVLRKHLTPRRINLYSLHKYVDTINILLKLQL